MDPSDGVKYTEAQFIEYYGQKQGKSKWNAAGVSGGAAAKVEQKPGQALWQPVKAGPPARGLVQTKLGAVHYVSSGSFHSKLTPILAFHMSPSSVDEFRMVRPILSKDGRLVVCIDELGYGCSDNPTRSCTLDEIAEGAMVVARKLRIKDFICLGSLMGCFFSLSLAAKYPKLVKAVILTNCYMWPEDKVKEKKDQVSTRTELKFTDWELKDDGSHIVSIFNQRKDRLDADLNTRVTLDALKYNLNKKDRYAVGIDIQDGPLFEFEEKARNTKCPVLAINSSDTVSFFDKIGMQFSSQFDIIKTYFSDISTRTVGGSLNVLNTNTKEWSDEAIQFLDAQKL